MRRRSSMVSRFARVALVSGTASVLAGVSVKAVAELILGARLAELDEAVLRAVASFRTGWLNGAAADFTALGSGVLLAFATVVVAAVLISTRDAIGTAHLGAATVGAAILTRAFKESFARPRPAVVEHLVHVSQTGFSYPSGHALGTAACYFSFALIARRHLPRHASREILVFVALACIVLVSLSRVYLGVHYASDVVAGMLIGAGWSLLLAGAFSTIERRMRRLRRSQPSLIAADAED